MKGIIQRERAFNSRIAYQKLIMQTKMMKASTKEDLSSLSLNRILLEITNFQGIGEAENEMTWNKLLNKIDFGTKKTNSKSHPHKELNAAGKSFRDLLVNDNIVIIDKTPSQVRRRESSPRFRHHHHHQKSNPYDNDNDKNPISQQQQQQQQLWDAPQPNVVRRVRDIFETLYLEPRGTAKVAVPKPPNIRKPVSRSKSLCTANNYREQKHQESSRAKSKQDGSGKKLLQPLEDGPEEEDSYDDDSYCCGYRSADEEKREWLNGCSPISPEAVQKIREHGTSVTFFGRPAYSVRSSPIFMNDNLYPPPTTLLQQQHFSDADWPKPKIIETTSKYYNGSRRSASSLCSSSISSEDGDGFDSHNNSSDLFDYGCCYYSVLASSSCHDKDYRSSSPEDCYSYDIVYLSETYSRSSTPRLGIMNKGIWLRDPYWRGSSYIIYDFRGTDVESHIRNNSE